jgi:hypothetical protein
MSNKKYILAKIRLPMEVLEDGSLKNLSEYLTMDFERLDELPPLPENNENYEAIRENLKSIISISRKEEEEEEERDGESIETVEEERIITFDELNKIKDRVRSKNMTFKNKSGGNRYTAKNYSSLMVKDVDPSPQSMVQEEPHSNDL